MPRKKPAAIIADEEITKPSGVGLPPPPPQQIEGESITFSLRAHPGDTVYRRYQLARHIGVSISSPFRRDLNLYDILLTKEEEGITGSERKAFIGVVRTLALNASIRAEVVPDRVDLVRYLRLAGKESLGHFVTNATTIRLFLIVDRAREHAGRIELAATQHTQAQTQAQRSSAAVGEVGVNGVVDRPFSIVHEIEQLDAEESDGAA